MIDLHASTTEICGFLVNGNESGCSGQTGGRVFDGGGDQCFGPYFGSFAAANGCGTSISSTTARVAAWYVHCLFLVDLSLMIHGRGVHVDAHHGPCVSLQRHSPLLFFDGVLIGLVQSKESDSDVFFGANDGYLRDHPSDVLSNLAAHFDYQIV